MQLSMFLPFCQVLSLLASLSTMTPLLALPGPLILSIRQLLEWRLHAQPQGDLGLGHIPTSGRPPVESVPSRPLHLTKLTEELSTPVTLAPILVRPLEEERVQAKALSSMLWVSNCSCTTKLQKQR